MEGFVIRQNVEHYRAMLKVTTDLEQRGVIEKLLCEEEAKLKKYDEDHKKTPPASSKDGLIGRFCLSCPARGPPQNGAAYPAAWRSPPPSAASIYDNGEYHALVFPCRRDGSGWRDVRADRPVRLSPTHWRRWDGKSR